jgi:hypothetical protein
VSQRLSEEEKLAREAMAHIRNWLGEKADGCRKFLAPRVAIKFCGGCNPSFERTAVAQILRRDLANVSWVLPEEDADLLVIINGCLGSCAERPEVQQKALEILVIRNHSVSTIIKKKC